MRKESKLAPSEIANSCLTFESWYLGCNPQLYMYVHVREEGICLPMVSGIEMTDAAGRREGDREKAGKAMVELLGLDMRMGDDPRHLTGVLRSW